MNAFDWRMAPEMFVEALRRHAVHVRKTVGGGRGARRHAEGIVRRRRSWYLRLNRLTHLPALAYATGADAAWASTSPEDVRIVIPNGADVASLGRSSTSEPERPRKRIRRLMHEAALDRRRITLVNARSARRRLPAMAVSEDGAAANVRALYLEALGVALVPGLSEEQVQQLEGAGAVVLRNDLVAIDDPDAPVPTDQPENADHLEAISIAQARSAGLTGKGVLIGVLDSGVDPKHPEFVGKKILFMAFRGDGERRPKIATKDFGWHGTHVSALCAGRNVGVAPDADLAVAAVLTSRDAQGRTCGTTAQILAGMNWLAGVGQQPRPVDVVNASVGAATPAIYHAPVATYRLTGTLLIGAIGNGGRAGFGHHLAPGMLDCAMAVGAVDFRGIVADFSDWGDCFSHPVPSMASKPDIMAPGVEVKSAVPGGGYARKNGTSMACPIVTGAAALLIERDDTLRGDPDALADAVLALSGPLPDQGDGYDPRRGGRGQLSLSSL